MVCSKNQIMSFTNFADWSENDQKITDSINNVHNDNNFASFEPEVLGQLAESIRKSYILLTLFASILLPKWLKIIITTITN